MKSKVMLIKNSDSLGMEGDIVTVPAGYARNFLIPDGIAIPYNEFAKNLRKSREKKITQNRERLTEQFTSQKAQIEASEITIKMKAGEDGKLFGSVTAMMVADELAKIGLHINRSHIRVPHGHIGMIGDYTVPIHLSPGISASIPVHVIEDVLPGKKPKIKAADLEKEEAAAEAEESGSDSAPDAPVAVDAAESAADTAEETADAAEETAAEPAVDAAESTASPAEETADAASDTVEPAVAATESAATESTAADTTEETADAAPPENVSDDESTAE